MPRPIVLAFIALVGCSDNASTSLDTTPPEVVSIEPADGAAEMWLHEPIRITFSEPIHPDTIASARLVGPAGDAIPVTVTATADAELTVVADDAAIVVGALQLVLGSEITDLAGNALAETTASWMLSPWSRSQHEGVMPPTVAIDDNGRIVLVRTLYTTGGRRVAVSERRGGAWVDLGGPLGTRDAAVPSLVLDTAGRPFLVWTEFPGMDPQKSATIACARWDGTAWETLPSPGDGAFAVAAQPPGGDPIIAYTTASPIGNGGSVVRVRVFDGTAWQQLAAPGFDVPVNGAVAGLPQIAAVTPGTPLVAFAESGAGSIPPQVRILRWTGQWSEVSPITLQPPPTGGFNRVAIAARGSEIVVGYDDYDGSFGVYAVRVTGQTWVQLGGALDVDPSGDAAAPSLALDADGAPVIAWRESIDGNLRGLLARWNGNAWSMVGGHVWNDDPSRTLVRPALALLRGRVPVVAWVEQPKGGSFVRVAHFNGPKDPPVGGARVSIAGCAFDASTPAATLSATGCFTIANGLATPHPGLVPFDLTSELWSDGALKRRWMALPDGRMMDAPAVGAWTAPAGAFMIKEFAIETTPGDARTRRVIETRFLVSPGSSGIVAWQGFSFRWRHDGTEADLLPDAPSTVAWPLATGGTHVHSYPSRAQCARCHHPSVGPLLGVRTAQLARRFDHDGVISDQLEALAHAGVIAAQNPVAAPVASPHDTTLSLETRVRGYLAANCSHCHNPTGERATRDLRWETPLGQTMLCGPDSEVVAGNPAASVLVQRISTRTNGMPPIATLQTDPLAIGVVTRWIQGETNCP